MKKTNWITQQLFADTTLHLKGVTSLTLHNVGEQKVYFRHREFGKGESFLFEGDGTASDVEIDIKFDTGKGIAILDYRALVKC